MTTFVVTNVCQIINLFFETQIRIFYIFFHKIVGFFIGSEKKVFFLEKCFDFVLKFIKKCMKIIKIPLFEKIFLDFEYSSFPIKIINKKYIEYCDKKYTN